MSQRQRSLLLQAQSSISESGVVQFPEPKTLEAVQHVSRVWLIDVALQDSRNWCCTMSEQKGRRIWPVSTSSCASSIVGFCRIRAEP